MPARRIILKPLQVQRARSQLTVVPIHINTVFSFLFFSHCPDRESTPPDTAGQQLEVGPLEYKAIMEIRRHAQIQAERS